MLIVCTLIVSYLLTKRLNSCWYKISLLLIALLAVKISYMYLTIFIMLGLEDDHGEEFEGSCQEKANS